MKAWKKVFTVLLLITILVLGTLPTYAMLPTFGSGPELVGTFSDGTSVYVHEQQSWGNYTFIDIYGVMGADPYGEHVFTITFGQYNVSELKSVALSNDRLVLEKNTTWGEILEEFYDSKGNLTNAPAEHEPVEQPEAWRPYITVTTDKTVYAPGETVSFTLDGVTTDMLSMPGTVINIYKQTPEGEAPFVAGDNDYFQPTALNETYRLKAPTAAGNYEVRFHPGSAVDYSWDGIASITVSGAAEPPSSDSLPYEAPEEIYEPIHSTVLPAEPILEEQTTPEQAPAPVEPQTVNPTPSTVYVDGIATAFEAYNIWGNNYFKLRDVAMALSGTPKQFGLGYDATTGAVTMTQPQPYTPVGGELAAGDGSPKAATLATSNIYLNGALVNLTAYNIGGNNFFKLVDLMEALNIGVSYDDVTKAIGINTAASFAGVRQGPPHTSTPRAEVIIDVTPAAPTPSPATAPGLTNAIVGYDYSLAGGMLTFNIKINPAMAAYATRYVYHKAGELSTQEAASIAVEKARELLPLWKEEGPNAAFGAATISPVLFFTEDIQSQPCYFLFITYDTNYEYLTHTVITVPDMGGFTADSAINGDAYGEVPEAAYHEPAYEAPAEPEELTVENALPEAPLAMAVPVGKHATISAWHDNKANGFLNLIKENGDLFAHSGINGEPDANSPRISNVASVSNSASHVMLIKTDGSLWAYGDNTYGQLGDGTLTNRNAPEEAVKIMDGVAFISAGYNYSAAIKTDGSLWMWGRNDGYQLGDGTEQGRSAPVKVMDNAAKVSAGFTHTMVVKRDGTLWGFGDGNNSPAQIMGGVIDVSVGYGFTLVIKSDNSLWGWGENGSGQLGAGEPRNVSEESPVKIMDGVIAADTANTYLNNPNEASACALKTDGSLWTWGDNGQGQLGDGTRTGHPAPAKVMDNITAVTMTRLHTYALKPDGTVWVLGVRFGEEVRNMEMIGGVKLPAA